MWRNPSGVCDEGWLWGRLRWIHQEEVAVKSRSEWQEEDSYLKTSLSLQKWDHIILFSTCYFHFVVVIFNID